jgi:hypothetical protein
MRQASVARLLTRRSGSPLNAVLQSHLPSAPWMAPATRRLPGVQPLPMEAWLIRDEAFAPQMALRDALIAERRDSVFAAGAGTRAARAEALALVLGSLDAGYTRAGHRVTRPDGVTVDLSSDDPLVVAGRLVQADLCLLTTPEPQGEPVLTDAILCFPASWTLAEKIGRPLADIHIPVDSYTPDMAARVRRLFTALRPGRPLWRQNALLYADPALHQPRPERAPRRRPESRPGYLRSERQVLLRLAGTGAVLFAIHTYVLPVAALSPAQTAALEAHPIEHAGRNA